MFGTGSEQGIIQIRFKFMTRLCRVNELNWREIFLRCSLRNLNYEVNTAEVLFKNPFKNAYHCLCVDTSRIYAIEK